MAIQIPRRRALFNALAATPPETAAGNVFVAESKSPSRVMRSRPARHPNRTAAEESSNVELTFLPMSMVIFGFRFNHSGSPVSLLQPSNVVAKNLSVNNVDRQRHLAERDDRCGDVIERDKTAVQFLVSHEKLSEAVEPAMADLNHPAACLLGRIAPLGVSFLAATDNMRNVAVRLDDLQGATAAIAGIGTQVLVATNARRLALDHDGLQHCVELRDVMLIRPGHDERQRDATAVHQQMTLAPLFFPDPSGWDRQTLAPAAP